MIIEMFFRSTGQEKYWTMIFKAKYNGHTSMHIATFESFSHAHLQQETFVQVRVWEKDYPRKQVEGQLFLDELKKMKKRNSVDTVMSLYEKYKAGEIK